jgi:hypothetical protein
MTALIVIEAACIVLLGLLTIGLLRSHAEILRQLHELGAGRDGELTGGAVGSGAGQAVPVDIGGATGGAAHDLVGETPGGEAAAIAVTGTAHDSLLAFLSSGCLSCAGFWEALAAPGDLGLPPNTRVVAVTKSPVDESTSAVARLAPRARPVVMSTDAWLDYAVPGAPYFVHVSGARGRVMGEGSAGQWDQVVSLATRAREDQLAGAGTGSADGGGDRRSRDAHDRDRIDQELAAAGILPGDDALYPASPPVAGDQP